MLCTYAALSFMVVLVHGNVFAQPFQPLNGNEIQANEKKEMDQASMDNVAEADEHHKIVILVPQIIRQEAKKPKSHHHHHKVLPVVHSGKVIHAHHHHGKVDHQHKHDGKGKHDHKHTGSGAHKHSHFGVGSYTHKHSGKGSHDHKHVGKAAHSHGHSGKGTIHHHHSEHHHHEPAPPKPPKKYTLAPFYGFDENANYQQNGGGARVKIDSQLLRALNPAAAAFSGAAFASGTPGRFIQIRIPDENEPNVMKEIDIDAGSDVAVLKKNYISAADVEGIFTGNQDTDEAGEDNEDDNVDEEPYQLGNGYKLAASAARAAAVADEDEVVSFSEQDAVHPVLPNFGKNNVIAYSDTYRYQY